MRKLSICIPVYNRKALFEQSLLAARKACTNHPDDVEIVVSDNASEDNLQAVVEKIRMSYPEVGIVYRRNASNTGLAMNFLKSVELANGEFCWIIGSDDFVLPNGVDSILRILHENENIDFISVAFRNVDLSAVKIGDFSVLIDNTIEKLSKETKDSNLESYRVEKWDSLVDPKYKNVLLGSVMTGVFRKSLWDMVDKTPFKRSLNLTSLTDTYPHLHIYSKCMIGRPAWFYGYPCVLAGGGYREWAANGKNSFWQSSLPVIYLKIFPEIIEAYKEGGLEKTQLRKATKWTAGKVGRVFVRYIWHKFVRRRSVMSGEHISIKAILKTYWSIADFYLAPLSAILKRVWRPFSRLNKDVV